MATSGAKEGFPTQSYDSTQLPDCPRRRRGPKGLGHSGSDTGRGGTGLQVDQEAGRVLGRRHATAVQVDVEPLAAVPEMIFAPQGLPDQRDVMAPIVLAVEH